MKRPVALVWRSSRLKQPSGSNLVPEMDNTEKKPSGTRHTALLCRLKTQNSKNAAGNHRCSGGNTKHNIPLVEG